MMGYILKRTVLYKSAPFGSVFTLPALFTEKGILLSHLRYLYERRNKSQSWQERNTFSIELLLLFISRQVHSFSSATKLLNSFVDALCFGTIENGIDASGLYWRPRRNEDVNVLLRHITDYCDYIDRIHGVDFPQLNPMRKASYAEERLRWCAYYRRNSRCFLNHLNKPSKKELSMVRAVYGQKRHFLDIEAVYRFPEGDIERLISEGFKSSTGKEDYGSQLIVMLMHYGGLRLSECFHIYIDDISIDSKTGATLISVYHPSDGRSPDSRFNNRREFLAYKHRLEPRNEYSRNHKLYSGWKGPMLTSQNLSFDIMFYPPCKSVEFTLTLQKYLSSRGKPLTPFLFVNSKGEPESKKNFINKHCRAISRIGLEHSKSAGTSPHGHRHSFGYRLSQCGFTQLEIQKAMHHKSPDSCLVYLQSTSKEIRNRMRQEGL